MALEAERLPVIVACGQTIEKEQPVSAADLMTRAAESALARTGALAGHIDAVSVTGIMSKVSHTPAFDLARTLHLSPRRTETTQVGGNFPQWLVSRAADSIATGNSDAVLIAGVETQHSQKLRRKMREQGIGLPKSTPLATFANAQPDPVVGDDRAGISSVELAAGLIAPVHIYPMFENVIAHKAQRDYQSQRDYIARFLARFSEVAAENPFAWFQQVRTPTELATITPENRLIAEPYPKLMSAFIDVNQAACLVVTSLAIATMTERLRENGGTGLVSGLGWYATKHSIGIYGASPPPAGWVRGDTTMAQVSIDSKEIPVVEGLGTGTRNGIIIASTIIVDTTGTPEAAPVIISLDDGQRAVGTMADDDLQALKGMDLVGRKITGQGTPPICRLAD